MDPAAFLGVNLTLNIWVDFNHCFFRLTLNIGYSPAEGGGEGDLKLPFNTGVNIKRHLKHLILGITVMSIVFKLL